MVELFLAAVLTAHVNPGFVFLALNRRNKHWGFIVT
jgi:hypothetical protein